MSNVTNLKGKVALQLKWGGKRFNRFDAQIISNYNKKEWRNSPHISQSYSKKLQLKSVKVVIFRYNNTELICKKIFISYIKTAMHSQKLLEYFGEIVLFYLE